MNSIVVTSTKQNIKFGYEGEDNVTKIIFPYDESWLEYGEGNFEVRILRCGDEVAYTATEVVDDRQAMTLTMTVTDIELSVRGRGEMQLCYVCPDSIKKSPIYQYTVNRSIDYKYAVDPPDGSIIASVEKSLSEIKNTTNRLSNSVISIENSINDVNSQINNINNKISEFDDEINSIGEVETRVDNLETSIQSINGRINTAEGNINENTESISDLNESVTELENRKVTDLETSGGKSDSGKYLTVGTDGKIKATSLTIPPTITVDDSLSTTSKNPVQNKVIKTELNNINSNIETCNTEISKINGSLGTLKADLVDNYVSKKGEHQVTPQNLKGMQYTKTTGEVEGDNIFSSDMLFEEGYYISINTNTGMVAHSTNSSFNAYCIPVEQNSKYKFTKARFVVLATGNTVGSPAIGELQSNISEIETGLATYMFLSINVNSINDIYVKPVTTDVVYSDFILPDWLVDNLPTVEEKPKFATVTGNISSGENLQLTSPKNNLRKGERIVFDGNISSFDSIRIGLTYGTSLAESQQKNFFVIDDTNISYYPTNTATPIIVAHGLTLANNIQIIWEMSAEASVKFTLISNGNMFTHVFTPYTRQAIGNPFVLSDGTVLTDCKLTWTCTDLCKDIWMFGDSYFAYSEARWTYYLHQYGYDDNCLLDGFPGEGSVNGRVAFNNLLRFGTPKFAVWCLGMNDTTDSETAPAMPWVTNRDLFLQYCQNNNVTPIFGTIPTVPTINHEQKNAWVRSSGYRYIDFAKAVGAQSDGAWYSGMLANDGVHPTAQGAKALFARVLVDFPEIMLIN